MRITILLESQRDDETRGGLSALHAEISCIKQLVVDLRERSETAFKAAFGCDDVAALWSRWSEEGANGTELANAAHLLRKSAFSESHIGEVAVQIRNVRNTDVQPGIAVALAAVLEYVVCLTGSSGRLRCSKDA